MLRAAPLYFLKHNSYKSLQRVGDMQVRGLEFGFNWLFVLLVGAAILTIAFFVSQRLTHVSEVGRSSQLSASFDSLLNPLETKGESATYHTFILNEPLRFDFSCSNISLLGEDSFTLRTRSGSRWSTPGVPARTRTKYIFANSTLEGKEFYAFVTPFSFPYKIADLFFFYAKPYCFVQAPEEVRSLIEQIGAPTLNLSERKQQCPSDSIKVCFEGTGCDILVQANGDGTGVVIKDKKTLDYTGALLYGAIFASPERYSCEVSRLRQRTALLAQLYLDKAALVSLEGCSTNLEPDLLYFSTQASGQLRLDSLSALAHELEERNEKLSCPLF